MSNNSPKVNHSSRADFSLPSQTLGRQKRIYNFLGNEDEVIDQIQTDFSKLQTNFTHELPHTENQAADFMAQANQIFNVFRELWISLYIHDLRKTSNKRQGRHILDEGDYVLVLDRVKTNHINSYGVIIEKISPHHLRVKIISRQATLDNDYNIVRPAKTIIIDRAPESLVLLSKGDKLSKMHQKSATFLCDQS